MASENCVRANCEYYEPEREWCHDIPCPVSQVDWCGIWFDDPHWDWADAMLSDEEDYGEDESDWNYPPADCGISIYGTK